MTIDRQSGTDTAGEVGRRLAEAGVRYFFGAYPDVHGVPRLPTDLGAAVAAFRKDELMAEVLGDEVHAGYADYKAAEWLEYNTVVGEWERSKYLELW